MSEKILFGEEFPEEMETSSDDVLFNITEEFEVTEDIEVEEVEMKTNNLEEFKRQTYYVTEELVDAMMMYKAYGNKDISVIVREALYAYIPKEHLDRARNKHKN